MAKIDITKYSERPDYMREYQKRYRKLKRLYTPANRFEIRLYITNAVTKVVKIIHGDSYKAGKRKALLFGADVKNKHKLDANFDKVIVCEFGERERKNFIII